MDEWGATAVPQLIQPESTRAAQLPASIRYRAFEAAAGADGTDGSAGAGSAAVDYHIHKRRRIDPADLTTTTEPTVPLLSVLTSPFEIAARQYETFQWLTAHRTADDITGRFALDRKIGALPSLAAINRSLMLLGATGNVNEVLDTLEDLVVDTGDVPSSTLQAAISALHSDPVRAACLAFSLERGGADALPPDTWVALASDLARASQQLPKPLDDAFVELFEASLQRIRANCREVNEALIVAYGTSLLSSGKNLVSVVRLVQDDLLSGRNRAGDGLANLQLGAFLSELLTALCIPGGRQQLSAEEGGLGGDWDLLQFACDVVKYAYARRVNLMPVAFDAVLLLCDEQGAYYRLCILFTAMCVLSSATLRALLRTVEVVNDVPALRPKLVAVMHRSPANFYLWCLRRFGGAVLAVGDAAEAEALLALCHAMGRAAADDGDDAATVALYHHLADEGTAAAAVRFLVGYLTRRRQLARPSGPERARAEAELNAGALDMALAAAGPAEETAAAAAPLLAPALQALLPTPAVYCNVLDRSALDALAASRAAEEGFVRMMARYAGSSGALVLVPADVALGVPAPLAMPTRQLLRAWRAEHTSWFRVLPLSHSLQLEGGTPRDVALSLFSAVRQTGHKKVAFVTQAREEAAAAKESGVQPVIHLGDLLQRLGVAAPLAPP